jgi:Leucine-rich repeat (LRR) protein
MKFIPVLILFVANFCFAQVMSENQLIEQVTYTSKKEALKNPSSVVRIAFNDFSPMEDGFIFKKFTACQLLDLSVSDNVKMLPFGVKNLKNLQYINLNNTKVEYIFADLKKLKNLKAISVVNANVNQNDINNLTKKGVKIITSLAEMPEVFKHKNLHSPTSNPGTTTTKNNSSSDRMKDFEKEWEIKKQRLLDSLREANIKEEAETLKRIQNETNDKLEKVKLLAKQNNDELNLHLVVNQDHIYTLLYNPNYDESIQKYLGKNGLKKENSGILVREALLDETNYEEFFARINEFPNVRKIIIMSTKGIGAIPASILTLKNLSVLNLLVKDVAEIPDLSSLRNLKSVMIPKVHKNAHLIGNLTQLDHLSYCDATTKEIPSFLFNLKNLKSLSFNTMLNAVETNSLTQLKGISSFTNLESLELSHSHNLKDLPEELNKLKKLKTLLMSGVTMKYVPKVVGEITSLEVFDMAPVLYSPSNRIEIPENFKNLTNLTNLTIYNKNDIPGIENMTKLESFSGFIVNKNLNLEKLQKLKKISIASSNITEFPLWITKIHSLEDISLEVAIKNCVIPEDFKNLKKLKRLILQNVGLNVIPDFFKHFDNLESLQLGYNNITTIPEFVYSHKKLNTLVLSRNPIPQAQIDRLRKETKIKVTF